MAHKRKCTEPTPTHSSDDSDRETTDMKSPSYPRFLLMEATENKQHITKLSPFVIQKTMQSIIGTVDSIKKLKSDQLLIETNRKTISDKLLNLTEFSSLKVKVTPHQSLNSSKGVIRCPDLSGVPEEEIKAELTSQEVSSVRRISFSKDGNRIPTNTIVLTFSNPNLPKTIKVGYLVVKVAVYIPNPLRCFDCQKFGHHETKCNSPIWRCGKCGVDADLHNEQNCPNALKCVNCNGPHESRSRECPAWKKEKEILKIKYTNNISFPEARKIVNEKQIQISEKSYASIIKSTSHTSEYVDHATQFEDINGVQSSDRIIIPTQYKKSDTVVSPSESGLSINQSTSTTQSQSSQSSLSNAEKKAAKKAAAVSKETAGPSGTSGRGQVARGQSPEQPWTQARGRQKNRGTDRSSEIRSSQPMDTQEPSAESKERSRKPILPP